jgi:hypothetical protein
MNLQEKQSCTETNLIPKPNPLSFPFTNREKKEAVRNHVRFLIRDCVLVEFNANTFNLGEVLNVSMGGLGLRCFDHRQAMPSVGELRIFSTTGDLRQYQIPFETAWSLFSVYHLPSGRVSTRHCGVKFGPVTKAQKRALRSLIENHSTEDPEG